MRSAARVALRVSLEESACGRGERACERATARGGGAPRALEETICAAAAKYLEIPPGDLDPEGPLTRWGLDSLGAVELAAAIEQATGLEVPPDLVRECSDIRSLSAAIGGYRAPRAVTKDLDLMQADAVLPPDIRPAFESSRGPAFFTCRGAPPPRRLKAVASPRSAVNAGALSSARCILLTGATGFVGRALLRALLDRTNASVVCLVRPRGGSAGDRLAGATSDRVRVIEGDLEAPRLGLSGEAFAHLAARIDAICHAGAIVNWVLPYAALRGANVAGTRELLRLACLAGDVPFHFVSSLSVCYATSAPREVDERFDPLPHLAGLHFGYAQSKAVAEALVGEAGARGLPVRIYRPALVSGDSGSGSFNPSDLLSRLVAGCVRLGTAPDLDWTLDAVPVDVLADAILRMSGAPARVFHIAHPRPRHWRECVLWMRLFGYPLRLVPYREWLRQLDRDTAPGRPPHPLTPLRSFFLKVPDGHAETLPELHEETRRSHARVERTTRALERAGGTHVPLDAALLQRYFDAFIAAGHIPRPPSAEPRLIHRDRLALSSSKGDARWRARLVERLICEMNPEVDVRSVVEVAAGSDHSVISELTAWSSRRPTGLFRFRVELAGHGKKRRVRACEVFLKLKAHDRDAVAVGEALARLADDRLGEAYSRWSDRLGLIASHEREVGLYRQTDPRFTRHVPAVLGLAGGGMEIEDTWAIVLESVRGTARASLQPAPGVGPRRIERRRAPRAVNDDVILLDSADRPDLWQRNYVSAAIRGLAALHSIWLGREAELARLPWIGHVRSPRSLGEMSDLWRALADHAAPIFASFLPATGRDLVAVQRELIDRLPAWAALGGAVPRTLIHHDFNPRNICLRRRRGRFRLCAFDWELATVGAPQRDLVELLAFVSPEHVTRREVNACLEEHRLSLERESGFAIDPAAWREGFRAALYEMMLDRLPFYALVDRVKPQPFLPRVVRTWFALYRLYPLEAS